MLDHVLIERNTYRAILMEARKKYLDTLVAESKTDPVTEGETVGASSPESAQPETWNAKDEHLEERHGLE